MRHSGFCLTFFLRQIKNQTVIAFRIVDCSKKSPYCVGSNVEPSYLQNHALMNCIIKKDVYWLE